MNTKKSSVKLFYIGERSNPQLPKSYYKAYGQLSKIEVKRKEETAYGSMTLTSYDNEESYNKQIHILKEQGYSVL